MSFLSLPKSKELKTNFLVYYINDEIYYIRPGKEGYYNKNGLYITKRRTY